MSDNYHKRPEWSYSQLKNIVKHGIDWAMADKLGMLPKPSGMAIDLGTLIHQELLGGDKKWVAKAYPDYRTKEAREWRDSVPDDIAILGEDEVNTICSVVANIKKHPRACQLLGGDNEIELYATVNGLPLRGKADNVIRDAGQTIKTITDLKTTAKFDEFKYTAFRNCYDLQAAVYTMLAAEHTPAYYFVIAETIPPYRVQVAYATNDFIDKGKEKLDFCLTEVQKYAKREDQTPNFCLNEELQLGDWSI